MANESLELIVDEVVAVLSSRPWFSRVNRKKKAALEALLSNSELGRWLEGFKKNRRDRKTLFEGLATNPELVARIGALLEVTVPMSFDVVLEEELSEIEALRENRGVDRARLEDGTAFEKADKAGLVGLALSGGGIRSATFNLGILQGLAKFEKLACFDYLSTVSGGGYIGSWLVAWIKQTNFHEVQGELKPEWKDHKDMRRGLDRRRNRLKSSSCALSAIT
jgi:hypothetical protein